MSRPTKMNKQNRIFRNYLGVSYPTWWKALKEQTIQLKAIKKLAEAFEMTEQEVINYLDER